MKSIGAYLAAVVVAVCVVTSADAASFEALQRSYEKRSDIADFWQLVTLKDEAIGYAHTTVTVGSASGKKTIAVKRVGEACMPGRGVVGLEETTFWDGDLNPVATRYSEKTVSSKLVCNVRYSAKEAVLRHAVDGAPDVVTRLPLSGKLFPEEDVYPLFYDTDEEGPRRCLVLNIQDKKVVPVVLDVKGIYEFENDDGETFDLLRIDSDRSGGIAYFFDPESGAFSEAEYKGTEMMILESDADASAEFSASPLLNRELLGRARSAWKRSSLKRTNDVLGVSISFSSKWKDQTPAEGEALRAVHGELGSILLYMVQHVGSTATLAECSEAVRDNIKDNPNATTKSTGPTTLGGVRGYRITYDVRVKDKKIPGLCYVVVHRGVCHTFSWIIEPTKKVKGLRDAGAVMQSIRFVK